MNKSTSLYKMADQLTDMALFADGVDNAEAANRLMEDAVEHNAAADLVAWFERAQYDAKQRRYVHDLSETTSESDENIMERQESEMVYLDVKKMFSGEVDCSVENEERCPECGGELVYSEPVLVYMATLYQPAEYYQTATCDKCAYVEELG